LSGRSHHTPCRRTVTVSGPCRRPRIAEEPLSTQVASTSFELTQLAHCLDHHSGFRETIAALSQGQAVAFDGVVGSVSALLSANLNHRAPHSLVAICWNQEQADQLYDDLDLYRVRERLRFPAWESDSTRRVADDERFGERIRTLKRLDSSFAPNGAEPDANADTCSPLIVTSIQGLLQPVPLPEDLKHGTRLLSAGDRLDIDTFRQWLVEHQFQPNSAVELPGEFSIRGGLIDLFASDWEQPARIELFGDEIESIRRFDIATQRSIGPLQSIDITPIDTAGKEHSGSFLQHLPAVAWILLIEPELAIREARRYAVQVGETEPCLVPDQLERDLMTFPLASAAAIAQGSLGGTCRLGVESVERFSGDVGKVREELDEHGQGQTVHIVAQTEAEKERLREIFANSRSMAEQRLQMSVGHLHQGFRLIPEKLILISGAELFQRNDLHRMPRRRVGKAIDSFMDLRAGDLVVHLAHGVGRYRGTEMVTVNGSMEEHLKLEFRDRTTIFVPATRIDLVQKYIGGTKGRPRLAKIGGKAWIRQKAAAEAAVGDLASEMLSMQAARRARPGISFGRDSDWQREFDAAFPYVETDDQLHAIGAIKNDMQAGRPTDRLLCGDVGFGKTEVAMRAAFKAVDNGYQVAILVPTTILAEQHFRTFRQRMAEFPFDIARLSRFCSTAEQREILKGLDAGRVDIVIGTHRLASRDVKFYNLGLVIIDEEQRFGVEVKERLKQLRSTVDVITMTATPIPRTLHMSLVGVRDISNLETAPEDRLAVNTQVTRFSPELIRHAVLRELNRGGQIYFVHNRVQDIQQVALRLHSIVPEAKIRIGHGQMRESELETVMVDFVNHRFDLLLATTIVESGLDIPNANTIFIDEANRYGLADLHQLRGRVGRYRHRAYCYLLVDPARSLTPNATRRLLAIEEFSDMGAGFAIAMRDLEIRGAGNLLGTQQSGHIANVGYELYCQLLENAVRKLRNLPVSLHATGRSQPARGRVSAGGLCGRPAVPNRSLPPTDARGQSR